MDSDTILARIILILARIVKIMELLLQSSKIISSVIKIMADLVPQKRDMPVQGVAPKKNRRDNLDPAKVNSNALPPTVENSEGALLENVGEDSNIEKAIRSLQNKDIYISLKTLYKV